MCLLPLEPALILLEVVIRQATETDGSIGWVRCLAVQHIEVAQIVMEVDNPALVTFYALVLVTR